MRDYRKYDDLGSESVAKMSSFKLPMYMKKADFKHTKNVFSSASGCSVLRKVNDNAWFLQ